jgi:hypothetical protein
MKIPLRALVVAAAGCLLPLGLHAGDKEKKQENKETVVPDELTQTDSKDKFFQSFCKTYTFKMTQGKTYLFDLKAQNQNFFPSMRIETAAGQVVAQEINGGFNATIAYRAPKTEDYQLIVTSRNRAIGKYTLNIALKFDKGEAKYDGNLLNTDPRYNNKIHKLFTVEMAAGATYQIDQKSKNMDCYLYFEDPDGKVLAEDDDSGGGLDSQIIHKANKAGKYRIVATSLGGNQTGAFTLSIRQTDPPVKEEKKK